MSSYGYRVIVMESFAVVNAHHQRKSTVLKNFKRVPVDFDSPKGTFKTLSQAVQHAKRVKLKKHNQWNFVKIMGPRGGEYRLRGGWAVRV